MKEHNRNRFTRWLQALQFRVDTTNYLFDKPKYDYQPLPWVGITEAPIRGEATKARWDEIKKHITSQDKSFKDIGSCVGYFCISASEEFGMYSVGIDHNDWFIRMGNYAKPASVDGKFNFMKLSIDEEALAIVPKTDITLCLAIWHHWVSDFGLERATNILRTLWELTNHTMFFESGEEETMEQFHLDFFKDKPAKQWLTEYLGKELPGATVEAVGEFSAGDYDLYTKKDVKRTLFKISRTT